MQTLWDLPLGLSIKYRLGQRCEQAQNKVMASRQAWNTPIGSSCQTNSNDHDIRELSSNGGAQGYD